MKQRSLIAILCAAICCCTKEKPGIKITSAPTPWRANGTTPQTSTFTLSCPTASTK
ncbi:MAG TPA: hypothetical protein VK787_05715 [Puia sp.]|nr:hypothetical protein [Puia sp.]